MDITFQIYQNAALEPRRIADLREEVGWERLEEEYTAILKGSHFHLSAREGEMLIGFLNVISDGVSHALICDLMVHPLMGGQGLGRALVELAVQLLREQGVRNIQVVFDPALENFYRTCGFSVYAGGQLRNG